ncbi:unnamed protein product [Heligmosomoides polygyrus]|uniref:Uncharacterized protein n=1 Tax=Heligmosomoides polygyrus TaxID=6339 RepID=A0A183GPK0_HELPZ|nr:unnamed protein product [Heligmosomoides polygyrus]
MWEHVGLQLHLTKAMFVRNTRFLCPILAQRKERLRMLLLRVSDREVNMGNDLAPELSMRKRAAWGALKKVEEVAKKTKNVRPQAHLFTTLFFLP